MAIEIGMENIFAISIHAPVKGATRSHLVEQQRVQLISIHAPVKGATSQGCSRNGLSTYFNPRTREGCDHLPARYSYQATPDFNPRTREGCDQLLTLFQN